MALPTPPPYINPIPNNPFYSPESYLVKGAYYSMVVGAGLFVSQDGTISSTGGGGGAVSSIIAGPGISVNAATGNVTVTNTGVTNILAGTGISVSSGAGAVTINSLTTGTVLAVNTGAGLTGGPITTSGTIALATTGVTPGIYTNPTLSIDGYGRIFVASNGTSIGSVTGTAPITVTAGTNPVVGISPATTVTCGAVLLSDAVNSTSSSTAATSLAVKTTYDIAVAAIPKSCITAAGTLITGTGPSTPLALSVGTNGTVLTACSSCVGGLYWGTGGGATVPSATPILEGIVYGCTAGTTASVGRNALLSNTTGANNVAVGLNSLCSSVSASGNTAIGSHALCTANGPTQNTAVGAFSLCSQWASLANTAIGYAAMCRNGEGGYNVAVGNLAMCENTGGDSNVAIGAKSMAFNSVGNCNTAVGFCSLYTSTTGEENTSIGLCAQFNNIGGSRNTAIGSYALLSNVGGISNVALGYCSGSLAAGTGSFNVTVGPGSNVENPAGDRQLAIGYSSTCNWLTGNDTKAIKPGAGIIDCAASCGAANMVLTSQGNAVEWKPVNSVLAVPIYGSFYDTTATVPLVTPGTGQAVALGQTASANGISIQNTSEIHFSVDGTYNVQFSLQFEDSNASSDIVEVWLAKNGVALPYTNSKITLDGAGEAGLLAANIVDTFLATDYIEIYWGTVTNTVTLSTLTSGVGGPDSPNAIVTVVPVGA